MIFPISKTDIEETHSRIAPFIHNTPVLESSSLNQIAECELFFKCENFQKIGAFKMRGAINAIQNLSSQDKKNGIITHSSGNHAQAVAKAALLQNCKAYVVMPRTSPKVKVEAVKGYGGKVIFCEPTLEAREATVEKIIKKTNAFFIHPYDNYDVIAGQATAAKELLEVHPHLEAIICPVGGGGLTAGTILAANYFSNQVKVYAGEPDGADDAYQSIEKGQLIPSKNPNTIADGLLTSLGEKNFEIIKKGIEKIYLVTDHEIIAAMRLIWERLKIIIEPSCAVPLAVVLKNKKIFKNKKVGLILSGGNIDLNTFFEALSSKSS